MRFRVLVFGVRFKRKAQGFGSWGQGLGFGVQSFGLCRVQDVSFGG